MTKINNIAGISVATSASNNNINNYKFFISGGHEFADFAEGLNFIRENNWTLNVRGLEGIRIGLNKQPYGWELYLVNFDPTDCGKALQRRIYDIGQRLTSKKLEQIAEYVYNFISEVEDYESEQEETRMEQESEQCMECVARYQSEFDGYVEDLKSIAPNYDSLETSIDRFAAKSILEKMQTLSEDLLTALGEITRCDMVEEDGYWLDTTDLCRWYGRTDDFYVDDYDDLISTLDYKVAEMSAPLGCDKETLDFELGGYEDETSFLGLVADYPYYIWDELRDFISTYYHYAYCA